MKEVYLSGPDISRCRLYLLVLLQADEWFDKGVVEIHHCRDVRYYSQIVKGKSKGIPRLALERGGLEADVQPDEELAHVPLVPLPPPPPGSHEGPAPPPLPPPLESPAGEAAEDADGSDDWVDALADVEHEESDDYDAASFRSEASGDDPFARGGAETPILAWPMPGDDPFTRGAETPTGPMPGDDLFAGGAETPTGPMLGDDPFARGAEIPTGPMLEDVAAVGALGAVDELESGPEVPVARPEVAAASLPGSSAVRSGRTGGTRGVHPESVPDWGGIFRLTIQQFLQSQ